MQQSYEYTLIGTQPLNIIKSGPTGIVGGPTSTVVVNLTVSTDNGYQNGESVCYYSTNPNDNNTYIKMFSYLVESDILQIPPLPQDLYINMNTDLIKAICGKKAGRIDVIINNYKPDIQSALNRYLKTLGIEID